MTVRDTGRCQLPWVVLLSLIPQLTTAQTTPKLEPGTVRAALVPRVNDGTLRGIAAAWLEGETLRTTTAGVAASRGAAIDTSTRFELGEAGDLFTIALLASLVARGELSLDDPAQQFLPASIRLPARDGRAITLGDLAFHRSGLPDPSLPPLRSPTERIQRALNGTTLRFGIGSRYAFSRVGIEVLGLALARHLRMPLTGAISSRILTPLGIRDILPSSGPRLAGRDAVGHGAGGQALPVRRTDQWRGSITAVALFATAASDTIHGPLASTFALMMRTRSPGPDPALPVALGWRVLRLDGRDIYWHDAHDAPGFSTYLAVDPSQRRVSAVLSNSAVAVDAVAGALLLGRVPVMPARPNATPLTRPSHRRPGRR